MRSRITTTPRASPSWSSEPGFNKTANGLFELRKPQLAPARPKGEEVAERRKAEGIRLYEKSLAHGTGAAALLRAPPKKGARDYWSHTRVLQRKNDTDWTYLVDKNPEWNELKDRKGAAGSRPWASTSINWAQPR